MGGPATRCRCRNFPTSPSSPSRTRTTSRMPASSTRNGRSQTNHLHHGLFLRLDDNWFEAGGLECRVWIFESVTGHGRGDDAAGWNAFLFGALHDSGEGGGAGGFDEKAFSARK